MDHIRDQLWAVRPVRFSVQLDLWVALPHVGVEPIPPAPGPPLIPEHITGKRGSTSSQSGVASYEVAVQPLVQLPKSEIAGHGEAVEDS